MPGTEEAGEDADAEEGHDKPVEYVEGPAENAHEPCYMGAGHWGLGSGCMAGGLEGAAWVWIHFRNEEV